MFNQLLTTLSTTVAGLADWLEELTGGGETALHSHAGGGGGSAVLEDPEASYVIGGAVTIGDRIAETVNGALRVFEATATGTNDPETAFGDFTINLAPLGVSDFGDVDWRYLGIVGQVSWEDMPSVLVALLDGKGNLIVDSALTPDDGDALLELNATGQSGGNRVAILNADGSGTINFQDAAVGAVGIDFKSTDRGTTAARIGSDGFSVNGMNGNLLFEVDIENTRILLSQIPTADPVAEGQLWNDSGTIKISAGA